MLANAKVKGEGDAALAFVFSGAMAALILLPVTQLLDLKRAAGLVAAGLLCLALGLRIWAGKPLHKPAPLLGLALLGLLAAWLAAVAGAHFRTGAESRGQLLAAGVLLAWGLGGLPAVWGEALLRHWRRAALLVAVWALLQRAGLEWMPAYAAAGSRLRAMGSYGNAGYLAAFLCLSWPLALGWQGRRRYGALALLFAALLATQSRAGLAALAVQLLWLGWQAHKEGRRPGPTLGLALLAFAAAALYFFPPQAWLRPTLRPQLWSSAFHLWLQRPFLGWGPGSFALAVQGELGAAVQMALDEAGQFVEVPHQVFLLVAAEGGLLALAAFGFALAAAWRLAGEQAGQPSRWLLLGGLGLLAQSCADRFFFQPGVFLLACASLGLLGWRPALAPLRPRWQAALLFVGAAALCVMAARPLLAWQRAVGAAQRVPQLGGGTLEQLPRLQAEAKGGHDAAAWERLGAALASLDRFAEAGEAYREAMALEPTRGRAQNYGNCALMLGQPARAEDLFRQAVQLEPGSADARFSLGYALFQQRKISAAVAELDAALKLDPEHDGALKLKEQILN